MFGYDGWRGRNTKMPELMIMRGRKTGYKRWRSKWYKMLRLSVRYSPRRGEAGKPLPHKCEHQNLDPWNSHGGFPCNPSLGKKASASWLVRPDVETSSGLG